MLGSNLEGIVMCEARVCGLCPLGLVLRLAVKGVSQPGCQDQILAGVEILVF